ncbi:hypothetical protein NDU88_002482 [Pleurodeles waltl]|uniref:Uncharacterized protein n=1 Tax=Pleurodeles waltl TaxID=8319 RepID=A0AAV7RCV1_PLEWA|nr:hypothetical protein NDU88_002482 [Pleurodeles waltl]
MATLFSVLDQRQYTGSCGLRSRLSRIRSGLWLCPAQAERLRERLSVSAAAGLAGPGAGFVYSHADSKLGTGDHRSLGRVARRKKDASTEGASRGGAVTFRGRGYRRIPSDLLFAAGLPLDSPLLRGSRCGVSAKPTDSFSEGLGECRGCERRGQDYVSQQSC